MKRPPWIGQYVGLPFSDNGLTRSGLHCWGLVRIVLMEHAAITDLPTYGESSAADIIAAARHFRDDSAGECWAPVTEPRLFDVLLMTAMYETDGVLRRLPGHCGVMISASEVLHIWRETDSVIMRTDHHLIRNKKLGFYRHRTLK